MHIYMEMSQGNLLYSYLKQTKIPVVVFFKNGEQEGKTGPVWGWLVPVGEGRVRKGYGRVNLVQIQCTHVCKWKNEKNDTC
jgi:hypothetical protein